MKSQTKDKKTEPTKDKKTEPTKKQKTTALLGVEEGKKGFVDLLSKFAKAYEIPQRSVEEDRRRFVAAKARSQARKAGLTVARRGDAKVDYVNVLIKIPRKLLNKFDQYCDQEDYSRVEGIRQAMRDTIQDFKFDQMEEKDTENLKRMNELLENYKAAEEEIVKANAWLQEDHKELLNKGLQNNTSGLGRKAEEEFSNTL